VRFVEENRDSILATRRRTERDSPPSAKNIVSESGMCEQLNWWERSHNLCSDSEIDKTQKPLISFSSMPIKKTIRHGTPLESAAQSRLRAIIEKTGDDYRTAELFGISDSALVRAAAGLRLRKGTARAIELQLDAVEKRVSDENATSLKKRAG
jgi:hypothetical protein